jgi:formamidopyrimidine-DNA glycosylase
VSPESELLALAVTHSSYAAEHDCTSNELLEFLGDAVVDLAVADLIVTEYPELDEGSGSLRALAVVNEASLARAAQRLNLGDYIRIGRGEVKSHGLERPSLLADAFEAVVAALYLEKGFDAAKAFVHSALANDVATAALRPTTWIPRPDCASGLNPRASGCRSTPSRLTARPTRRPLTPRCRSAEWCAARVRDVRRSSLRPRPRSPRGSTAMPELPEVETVRASLARDLIGKKVKSAAVTNGRVVRRHKTAKEFRLAIEGHTIKSAQRLGKNLIFALENGTHLVVHLGMSGQLLRAKGPKDLKPKHTHVVFTFVQGGELRYVDPRTFGELYVSTPLPEGSDLEISKFARLSIGGDGLGLRREIPELAHLGVDPFEDQIGWDRFAAILRSRSTALKVVLTDQDIIAGLGNIYADETLFASGLKYDRPAESLSTIEIRRLHRAITEILTNAIKHGAPRSTTNSSLIPTASPAPTSSSSRCITARASPASVPLPINGSWSASDPHSSARSVRARFQNGPRRLVASTRVS